jgi:hypothetical protein
MQVMLVSLQLNNDVPVETKASRFCCCCFVVVVVVLFLFNFLFIQLKTACLKKYVYHSFNHLSFNKEDTFVILFIINTIVMFLAFGVIVVRLLSERSTDTFKANNLFDTA